MNKIKRSIGVDKVMTVVFYCIAIFFFALLIGFASYVIILNVPEVSEISCSILCTLYLSLLYFRCRSAYAAVFTWQCTQNRVR